MVFRYGGNRHEFNKRVFFGPFPLKRRSHTHHDLEIALRLFLLPRCHLTDCVTFLVGLMLRRATVNVLFWIYTRSVVVLESYLRIAVALPELDHLLLLLLLRLHLTSGGTRIVVVSIDLLRW